MINDRKGPRTATVQNDLNPQWEERLIVELVGEIQSLELQIKDDNMVSAAGFVASVTLPPELYTSSEKVDKIWLPLALSKWPNGKKDKKRDTAKLCISTRYINAADAVGTACPYTPYPQRSGCAVSLFADAHDSPLPDVDIDAGTYMPGDLWNEVYASLCVAQRFIYITGWSVWTGLKLNRLPEGVEHETLGELLKRKADEGVHVCVMVWNDATSYDFGLGRWSKSDGLMGVRDEETKEYFKDSKVVCEAVPCNSQGFRTNVDGTTSYTARLAGKLGKSANFTHHQKTIMCDEEAPRSDRRKVVAYVGGIDLCGGRYDDHTHPLFDTLGGVHKGDFYQCCIPGVDEAYGPREPWHDLHSKVEGPVARDVVHNFETRWKRQADSDRRDMLHNLAGDDALLSEAEDVVTENTWSVQMFRSIDINSAIQVLDVEKGCETAYIYQIRRAQKFIYVENQYFLGSSTHWAIFDDKKNNIPCKHRIPYELVMKIVSKIRLGERFTVYVTVPMYSEGEAQSAVLQGILYWQSQTVGMMYRLIADALKRFGPADAHPTDYLVFGCPGQRCDQEPPKIPDDVQLSDKQKLLLRTRRHQIYVHSKMAIFDDEYVLIGSANINQRSMDGARDTEIAVGCVEDAYTMATTKGGALPRGHVSGYRRRLWAEHLGCTDPRFDAPHTLECVRHYKKLMAENWEAFVGDTPCRLPHGHLMTYPYTVAADGIITPTVECFPDLEDVKAYVMGTRCPGALDLMTT
jgi:phospholipase D1/2